MMKRALLLFAALAACAPASTGTMPPPPPPSSAMAPPAAAEMGTGTYFTTIAASDLPSSASAEMQSGMVGMWELVVDRPGHATARFNGQQVVDTQFEVQGNQISFSNDSGQYACNATGRYTWEMTSAGLRFTRVEDPCDGRATALTAHPWARRP